MLCCYTHAILTFNRRSIKTLASEFAPRDSHEDSTKS